jgi:uncharacterized HhH-GPD family protein
MARIALHISGDAEADALVSHDPLALLIGMVLDQQVTIEKAFSSPAVLARRLGGGGPLDAASIAAMEPDELAAVFKERPALHRYPGSMAGRVQNVCRAVVEEYGGQADAIWKGVRSGEELMGRLRALPGFGEQKARIFAALLGKQLGVRPEGWQEASSPYGDPGTHLSVADIVDAESLATVRATKKAAKARARAVTAGPDLSGRRLYLCTPDRPDLVGFLAECIAGGVDIVQLRDKDLEARPLLARARVAAAVCRERGVPFVLNDRPDLALEAGADGVHVGQDDAPVALARRILGPDAIVGLSTHGPDDLAGAAGEEVSYISAGPVEATPTKPGRAGTGTGYVTLASELSSVPVFVTGGVTPERIPLLAAAGVRHFVVVRYLTQAPDARRAARGLSDAIDSALSSAPPAA